jgi:hypothetical protein
MTHRKHNHANIYQGNMIFNAFPEELRKIREEIRAQLPHENRKKIIAHKASEAEAWEEIKRACTRL